MLLLGTHAEPGKGVIAVRESDILYHTAIIGQSGSGKSYFLSRFLEEIILRTKARVFIVDPNGDFTHFYVPQEKSHWSSDIFDPIRAAIHSGHAPQISDFETQKTFQSAWQQKKFHIVSAGRNFRAEPRQGALLAPLMLHWKWLEWEQDFLLNIDETRTANLYQGVNTCIKYAAAHEVDYPQGYSLEDLEEIALAFGARTLPVGLWPEALTLSELDWLAVRVHFRQLRKRFRRLWYKGKLIGRTSIPNDLSNYVYNGFRWNAWQVLVAGLSGLDINHMLLAADAALNQAWNSAVISWQTARQRQSSEIEAKILKEAVQTEHTIDEELEEVEEPLEVEQEGWSDIRVPTFIVIDEAHNFAPEEPVNALQARVSDRIATIAAEGRKYGLFVVLATQRPQKLRRGLLSECENSAILRLQSKIERTQAAEALGIPSETVEHVGTFETGTALLQGRWVPAPLKTRFAPARTILGGGGLDRDYWQHT